MSKDDIQLFWDAGDMACGELVAILKSKISNLAPGSLFQIKATDSSAVEDLPAWAKLSKNTLVDLKPPIYTFKKKES